jgi:hypothetical protein
MDNRIIPLLSPQTLVSLKIQMIILINNHEY